MKKFILVVIPTMENAYHSLEDFVAIVMPIGLTSIAAVLEKNGYNVKIIDADAEGLTSEGLLKRLVEEEPDYVGSTCMTATMDITYDFYNNLKRHLPETKVIVGGSHVSALPKQTLEECKSIDYVVKGEGDITIQELMDAIENDKEINNIAGIAYRKDDFSIFETESRGLIQDINSLPLPAYHLLNFDLYRSYMWNNWVSGNRKPIGVVFTGRGCFGKCNFCATQVTFGNTIRFFSVERIKEEITLFVEKYNIKVLYFQDDSFTANRKLVNQVCDFLIESGYNKKIEINVSSRADTIHYPTLIKMKKAGIKWIFFGVESGNQKILDRMKKNIKLDTIRKGFHLANKAGFFVGGLYMVGHIGETWDTAMDTINFACNNKQDYAAFSIAIPFPGTELYSYSLKNNIKLPTWNEFGNVNTPPIPLNKALDVDKLIKLRQLAINKFFKRITYIVRLLARCNTKAIITDFIKMYFALKKEAKEKRL